jgi:hypothetical protein
VSWLGGGGTVECTVDVDIEKTVESFHAYTVPADLDINPGDVLHLHGVPTDIGFGEQFTMQVRATVERAGPLTRLWTRAASLFELTELYEVGFQSPETLQLHPSSSHSPAKDLT